MILRAIAQPLARGHGDRSSRGQPIKGVTPLLDFDFVGRPSMVAPGIGALAFTRASAAYRRNAAGRLESLAADVPRFDHHPGTLAPLGLHIEEARTNLMAYSEDLSSGTGGWTNDGCSAAGTNPAPDGAASAQKITEDTATTQHRVRRTISGTFTSGAALTVSCFLKAAGREFVSLQFGAANGFRAGIELATGTLVTGGAFGVGTYTSAGVEAYPGGWYRLWITGAVDPAATSDEGYINLRTSSGITGQSYTGDGSSGVLAWGFVVEAGAFPTSYIKTTSATVTRAADAATAPLGSWFNVGDGTALAEAQTRALASATTAHGALYIDDGTSNNRCQINVKNNTITNGVVAVGGAAQANIQLTQGAEGVPHRMALAWAENSFSFALDGTLGTPDTAGSLPSSLTTLRLGASTTATTLNGWVRRVAYWPRCLPNAVLQGITR